MLLLPDISLFGNINYNQSSEQSGRLPAIRVLGSPPRTFLLSLLIATGLLLCIYEQSMFVFWQEHPASPLPALIRIGLFHISLPLLLFASQIRRVKTVFVALLSVCVVNAVLNLLYRLTIPFDDLFRNHWGNFGFWVCCGIACYRFPFRLGCLIAIVSSLLLCATNGINYTMLNGQLEHNIPLLIALGGELVFCVVGCLQRSRAILFLELQHVQAQLYLQIQRTEELATTRERTRIARDIHDILAHSLTVLSIQVQAARQLARADPDQLLVKLGEMATLLRESMLESRRVVGLFRELPTETLEDTGGASVQASVKRFSGRTGINCLFEERGLSQKLNDDYKTTLLFVLQEALTNAHRHGQAGKIWTLLSWQEDCVILHVRDDGAPQKPHIPTFHALHGHHGLRGMRERAEALGGLLQAEKLPKEGFQVILTLPWPQLSSQDLLLTAGLDLQHPFRLKLLSRFRRLSLFRRK